jgi:hypothetical protein
LRDSFDLVSFFAFGGTAALARVVIVLFVFVLRLRQLAEHLQNSLPPHVSSLVGSNYPTLDQPVLQLVIRQSVQVFLIEVHEDACVVSEREQK